MSDEKTPKQQSLEKKAEVFNKQFNAAASVKTDGATTAQKEKLGEFKRAAEEMCAVARTQAKAEENNRVNAKKKADIDNKAKASKKPPSIGM